MNFKLTGPNGKDFDLYVKKGSMPTTDNYDMRGYTNDANENILFQNAEPGTYFVMVSAFQGSGDFDVQVSLD